jgi:glycerol-3-phosphate dehydrogenase
MPDADFDLFRAELARRYPLLPEDLRTHYGRLYGTEAPALLGDARTPSDLGRHWGSRLYEREVEYLRQNEWVRRPDDVLCRRTKHGLRLSPSERDAFARDFERAFA